MAVHAIRSWELFEFPRPPTPVTAPAAATTVLSGEAELGLVVVVEVDRFGATDAVAKLASLFLESLAVRILMADGTLARRFLFSRLVALIALSGFVFALGRETFRVVFECRELPVAFRRVTVGAKLFAMDDTVRISMTVDAGPRLAT